jgi:CAAX prenyl protease-like protein
VDGTALEKQRLLQHPAAPYVAPFAVFILFLAIQDLIPLPQAAEFALRIVVVAATIWFFSRGVLDFKLRYPLGTIAIGFGVFVMWIAPDTLIPGYRDHWLFHNSVVGAVKSSLHAGSAEDRLVLFLRAARAVIIVPIVEELFWRAWLMRWIINPEFRQVPLGAYQGKAFWLVALLFAAEHGPYWDVGLAAGAIYNWWMVRTRSLGDLIWAHAITNGALCAYVIYTHKWEFWL